LGEKERFIPFAGGGFGLVNYITPEDGYTNELLGDVHLSGGLKVRFTDFMGIRLQARLLLPLYWSGAYFYGGSAEDGYGVSSTCVMVQGDLPGPFIYYRLIVPKLRVRQNLSQIRVSRKDAKPLSK